MHATVLIGDKAQAIATCVSAPRSGPAYVPVRISHRIPNVIFSGRTIISSDDYPFMDTSHDVPWLRYTTTITFGAEGAVSWAEYMTQWSNH